MTRKQRYMPMWLAILVGIGVMLTLPLWVPVLLLWEAIREREKRRIARLFACLECGRVIGAEAVRLANRIYKDEMRRLWKQKPFGVKWRLAPRTLHAICPHCGARYTYREKERTFVIEEPWPPRARASDGPEETARQSV